MDIKITKKDLEPEGINLRIDLTNQVVFTNVNFEEITNKIKKENLIPKTELIEEIGFLFSKEYAALTDTKNNAIIVRCDKINTIEIKSINLH